MLRIGVVVILGCVRISSSWLVGERMELVGSMFQVLLEVSNHFFTALLPSCADRNTVQGQP